MPICPATLGFVNTKLIRDVEPGEMVIIDGKEVHSRRIVAEKQPPALCVFEYIYFARPDSLIAAIRLADQIALARVASLSAA